MPDHLPLPHERRARVAGRTRPVSRGLRGLLRLLALLALMSGLAGVRAATSDPTPSDPEWLVTVRQELKAKQIEAVFSK